LNERLRSRKPRLRPWEFVALTTQHPLPSKVGINVADKRRFLGSYCSLAEGGFLLFLAVIVVEQDLSLRNWSSNSIRASLFIVLSVIYISFLQLKLDALFINHI
jgi:hypothetical protein